MTVGQYLLKRLEEAGVGHVFGVPGDYILDFYEQLLASPLEHVGTCSEQGAGFAADAYARVNGLGVLCVTYCVGGFNALNAVAGAYAEKSPLIVISGVPGIAERQGHPLLHHQVKTLNTQLQIFERVTAAAVAVEDPKLAPGQIDNVIETCLREKRPVYIEFPAHHTAPDPWNLLLPCPDYPVPYPADLGKYYPESHPERQYPVGKVILDDAFFFRKILLHCNQRCRSGAGFCCFF